MANISEYLQKILDAVYGEEVRGSIHDAIQAMNVESSQAIKDSSDAKSSAKAYAAQAGQSATSASGSAAAAKVSETNAAASANAAKASETAAKASETSAISSSATASQKATEATASANTAKISEANAGVSASNAARDATDSSASAQEAKKSADDAASSSDSALNSAKVAAASADAAKQSEEKAAASQRAATISETNAAGSAQAAKASEIMTKESESIVLSNLEASIRYIKLLKAIDTLLADYTVRQVLTDSDEDPILDSDGNDIYAEAVGFDAFIRTVFELQVLISENRGRLKSLEERVLALEAEHGLAP